MENQDTPQQPTLNAVGKKENRFKKHFKSNAIFYGLLLAAFGYIIFQHLSFTSDLAEAQSGYEKEKETVYVETQKAIDINNEQALKMGLRAFVWAVRKEMLNENYEQVNQYILQYIKEKNISEIVIANAEGKIIYASNKKHEQSEFASLFPAEYLKKQDVSVKKIDEITLHLIAPIMALSNREGTIFMVYHTTKAKE